jgi:hypothetical protein
MGLLLAAALLQMAAAAFGCGSGGRLVRQSEF